MAVDVEQVRSPRVAVADVRHSLDVATADEERPEQDAGERKPAAQPRGHPGVDGGPPTRTEALAHGAVDRRAGLQPPPGDHREPGRRHDGDTERHPAARRVDVSLAEGQQRRGEEPVEGDERQLVDKEAENAAQAAEGRRPAQRRQGEQRAAGDQCGGHQVTDRHSGRMYRPTDRMPALGTSGATWHDRAGDQQTRRGAAPARPRAAAPGPRPDRPGVRAAAGRRGARPRRAHVGRAPQPRVPARVRRVAVLLPDDAAHRARDGAAAPRRPQRHRGLLRGRLLVAGHLQHPLHRAGRGAAQRLPARGVPARRRGCRRAWRSR